MCLELSHRRLSLLHSVKVPYFVKDNILESQTVRLIETVRLFFAEAVLRSYGTFNRVIWEIFQTVRLIETVLIIES